MLRAIGRATQWPSAIALSALGVGIVAVAAARGRDDLTASVAVACLICGPVSALAFDDPARAVLDAAPVSSAPRTRLRVATMVAASVMLLAVVVAVVRLTGATVEGLDLRPAEMAAASGVSLALAARRYRLGAADVGVDVVLAGPLLMLTVSGAAQRWPWLPSVGRPEHAVWWWVLAGVGWISAAWSSRDLYS